MCSFLQINEQSIYYKCIMLRYEAMRFLNLSPNKTDKASLRVMYKRKYSHYPCRLKILVYRSAWCRILSLYSYSEKAQYTFKWSYAHFWNIYISFRWKGNGSMQRAWKVIYLKQIRFLLSLKKIKYKDFHILFLLIWKPCRACLALFVRQALFLIYCRKN